jgi:tetratricopeptide (TPR) repeat protein
LTAFNWGTLAVIDADEDEDDKALAALEKAIAVSSADKAHGIVETGVGAQSYTSGASIEHRLGRDDEAERFFRIAINDYPTNGTLRYNYGRFKAEKGDMQAAIAEMTKAIELAPSYTLGYYGMGIIYSQLRQPAKAIEYVRRGLAVDPSDPLLQGFLRKLEAKGASPP